MDGNALFNLLSSRHIFFFKKKSSKQIMLRCPYVEKINLALLRNWMLPVLGSGGGPDVM
jgi:hypothetical protein